MKINCVIDAGAQKDVEAATKAIIAKIKNNAEYQLGVGLVDTGKKNTARYQAVLVLSLTKINLRHVVARVLLTKFMIDNNPPQVINIDDADYAVFHTMPKKEAPSLENFRTRAIEFVQEGIAS